MNTHNSYTNHVVHNLSNVCSNHTTFKLQRTRTQNMLCAVYISDKPVTLTKVIKPRKQNDNVEPSTVITMQSFKDLALRLSEKKPMLKVLFRNNEELHQFSPLNMHDHQKRWYIPDLLDVLDNPMKSQLNRIRTCIKVSVKTVWHCCDSEVWSRSLKVVWTGKAQWVGLHTKIDIYHFYSV